MIPIAEPKIGKAELKNAMEAIKSGWVSSRGRFIGLFEEQFARFHGMRYAVSTSNGTNALHLALRALDIGPGDEVIVPTFTFVASVNVIHYCGAKPVFVDAHPAYWGMDPSAVAKAITPRTRAIMIVHLYGHSCDVTPILAVAKKHKLMVVEDNAEGLGTYYRGRRTGTFSDISCFSFYGNKVMTTGEGGMCLTNRRDLVKRMAILRDHGMSLERRYWHEVVGFNYRMTNIQAAIGLAQLRQLETFLKKRRQIAQWYTAALAPLAKAGLIGLQPMMSWSTQNHWMFSILIPEGEPRRSEFMNELYRQGIEARPFFAPVHTFPPYDKGLKFPVAEKLSQQGLNLPMSVNLTRAQVRQITDAIRSILEP